VGKVVVLSRGHGYGHAATDLRWIKAMRARRPDLEVILASSGTGLDYYRSRSVPCIDLGISDDDDQGADAAKSVARFLFKVVAESSRPDLVVANEVFSAPEACRILKLRNLLLTHWFFAEIGFPEVDQVFRCANGVILLDFAAAHRVPVHVRAPVHFTGPPAKRFSISRDQARKQLGLASDSLAVVATFGSMRSDKLAEIQTVLRTVLAAWRGNSHSTDRLFVLSNPDESLSDVESSQNGSVDWVGITKTPELYYSAADLAISYATLITLAELARNGVPTVTILGTINPVDNFHATYFQELGLMRVADLHIQPNQLWSLGQVAMQCRAFGQHRYSAMAWGDPEKIAELILSYVPS
jgi:hypothetical protein